jgi:hypothetical protein
VETTSPINGNDLGEVAENLILETPNNSDEEVAETQAATPEEPVEVDDTLEDQNDSEVNLADDEIDEDYTETEEQTANDDLYDVKVNGEWRKVSIDELKQDFSGQKFIQERMQQNASMKKELEQAAQLLQQERQTVQEQGKQVNDFLQRLQQGGPPPIPAYPDEELRQTDPWRHQTEAEAYRRAVEVRQQWEQQAQQVQRQQQEQEQRELQAFLSEQAMQLANWRPELKDREAQKKFVENTVNDAKEFYGNKGFDDAAVSTMQTALEFQVLSDAIAYRKLVSKKAQAMEKGEGKRPVPPKPNAKQSKAVGSNKRRQQAQAQMQKTGSLDDVANFLIS